jgi:hypoxanthine-guanine phosphoribosyltransferase
MNFIKKVFDNQVDESVHLQFQKFSKGEFKNKALIQAKKSKDKYTINTTYEFANEFVRDMAEKLGNNKTNITGAIVSTNDLTGEIEFQSKKQFMGVKQYGINKELTGKEIIDLLNKFPKVFFALSFKVLDSELKIKAKAPKSAKPSTKSDEVPKADFCKLITTDKKFVLDFVFEGDFKKAEINHIFLINDIIAPKGETDFAIIRESAKRKGKIIRNATIDEKLTKTEKDFEA